MTKTTAKADYTKQLAISIIPRPTFQKTSLTTTFRKYCSLKDWFRKFYSPEFNSIKSYKFVNDLSITHIIKIPNKSLDFGQIYLSLIEFYFIKSLLGLEISTYYEKVLQPKNFPSWLFYNDEARSLQTQWTNHKKGISYWYIRHATAWNKAIHGRQLMFLLFLKKTSFE